MNMAKNDPDTTLERYLIRQLFRSIASQIDGESTGNRKQQILLVFRNQKLE
jgi:hypothetical protein